MAAKAYTQDLATALAPTPAFAVKESKIFSVPVLDLAHSTLRRCFKVKKEFDFAIVEIYILSSVALEAFVNEICIENIARRSDLHKKTGDLKEIIYGNDGRGMRVRDKWEKGYTVLTGKQFDKGKSPWQDFDTLINTRNALVHYDSEYKDVGYTPKYLVSTINRLSPTKGKSPTKIAFPSILDLMNSDSHWINRICSLPMGAWAIGTAAAMMRQFLVDLHPGDMLKDEYLVMLNKRSWTC